MKNREGRRQQHSHAKDLTAPSSVTEADTDDDNSKFVVSCGDAMLTKYSETILHSNTGKYALTEN